MDSETLDLYLQKLEVFLYDEDKIVTFKWLSSNLGISANDSKRVLKQYVHNNQNVKTLTLAITYVLSGILEDNTLNISIVKESELDEKKNQLVSILTEDIYSVQKSNDVDLNAIALVDYFSLNDSQEVPIIGSIKSKNAVKRLIKKKVLPEPPPPTLKGKTSFFTKVQPKTTKNTNVQDVEQNKDVTEPKNNTDTKSKSSSTTNVASKPKTNGIANFFNKNGVVNSNNKVEMIEKECTPIENNIGQEVNDSKKKYLNIVDSDSDTEKSKLESQPTITTKPNKNVKKKSNKRKCSSDQKEDSSSSKRRKRILELEDSDDDIFGNDEITQNSEDLVDESEDEVKTVVKITPLAPKNKKRKLIDSTYEDEEGYIITRKEWVEESASEEEAEVVQNSVSKQQEVIEKKLQSNESNKSDSNTKNKTTNAKANGTKGKKGIAPNQSTLMNFFKKK